MEYLVGIAFLLGAPPVQDAARVRAALGTPTDQTFTLRQGVTIRVRYDDRGEVADFSLRARADDEPTESMPRPRTQGDCLTDAEVWEVIEVLYPGQKAVLDQYIDDSERGISLSQYQLAERKVIFLYKRECLHHVFAFLPKPEESPTPGPPN